MSFEIDGSSANAECSKGYNIEFGDEVFGSYNTITDSILTSSGDSMYLDVANFYSAFVATSGGVDTECPRVVKRIAVTNDPCQVGFGSLALGRISSFPGSRSQTGRDRLW